MNRFSFKKNTSWYVFLFCFLSGPFLQVCRAQELYLRTFGEKTNPAVVFLHGGPGYNAASFEISTADTLSKRGFYVIVYDRRGEGRSQPASATYSFKESFSDLNQVYERAGIQSAMLVGHSFGGILGTLFAEKFPKKVHALALVSAPVNLQASFRTILDSSEALYRKNDDAINFRYLEMLRKMDTASLEYMSYCFLHAMQNGFYAPEKASNEAQAILTRMQTDTAYYWISEMSQDAPAGFMKTESYTTLNIARAIEAVKRKIPVIGLYGEEDGLYGSDQITWLKTTLGEDAFAYLKQCSHSVFIDRQGTFLEWMEKLKP